MNSGTSPGNLLLKLGTGLIVLGGWASDSRAQATPAPAQAGQGESIDAINADYLKSLDALEIQRMGRLAKLAESTTGEASDNAYIALFQAALSSGHYQAAEPSAEKLIKTGHPSSTIRYLAEVTNILSECDRGAYDDSLTSVARAIKAAQVIDPKEKQASSLVLPRNTRMSILETYYQKLVQAGQFEVARKAFQVVAEGAPDPAIREYAAGRFDRLSRIGKPAPELAGTDLDNKPFRLSDHKGKAVLVVFWASWCIPSGPEAEMLFQLNKEYKDKGLQIVGVNLDSMSDGNDDQTVLINNVKRFLVEHNVPFPNLISGEGATDYAKAFGVTDIPANFLVGRDGTLQHVDLTPSNIDPVIRTVLGVK